MQQVYQIVYIIAIARNVKKIFSVINFYFVYAALFVALVAYGLELMILKMMIMNAAISEIVVEWEIVIYIASKIMYIVVIKIKIKTKKENIAALVKEKIVLLIFLMN